MSPNTWHAIFFLVGLGVGAWGLGPTIWARRFEKQANSELSRIKNDLQGGHRRPGRASRRRRR
jgi:hypothetical protein